MGPSVKHVLGVLEWSYVVFLLDLFCEIFPLALCICVFAYLCICVYVYFIFDTRECFSKKIAHVGTSGRASKHLQPLMIATLLIANTC